LPKVIGFSLLTGEWLQVALYQYQDGGADPVFLGREEFSSELDPLERKKRTQAFFAKGGRSIRFVHLLMRERVLAKQFRFPSKNMNEISQMLTLRLPREIPFSIDQIVYHFHPIGNNEQNNFQTDILVFGVSKEQINSEYELLKSFGVVPNQIVLSTILLGEFAKKKSDASSGLSKIVLYGGGGKGELVVFNRNQVEASRSFTYDPADLIFSVQEALQSSFETFAQQEDTKLFDLYFCGEMVKVKNELFEGRYPNRFNLNPAVQNLTYLDFLFYVGANTYREKREFNLLPQDVKKSKAREEEAGAWGKLRFAFVKLIAVAVLLSLVVSFRMLIAVANLNHKLSSLESSVKTTREVGRAVQALNILKVKKVKPLDILAQVHEKAPNGIVLSEFEYNDKEEVARLKGHADSQAMVDQYVHALSEIAWFGPVALQYSENAKEASSQFEFSIKASLKKSGSK